MTNCDRCGAEIVQKYTWTPDYGVTPTGEKICYACCAADDEKYMQEHDRTYLYLTQKEGRWIVQNWPGSLMFKTGTPKKGRHNIAGVRYDVWFRDNHGNYWWGVQYGDFTEIVHCRKVKPWD